MITIGTHIVRTHITPQYAEQMIAGHTRFRNPEFEASRRYSPSGRPARGVPEFLELHEYDPATGILKLPRGLVNPLCQHFDFSGVCDLRILPREFAGSTPYIAARYELRAYQRAAVDAVVAAGGGVIVAGTGTGKTVIGLELSRQLATPTLFLVHTQTLLNQTVQAVRDMLAIEPGIIGGGKWNPQWFTVATLQTLSSRGVCDLADKFGLVILDEAHHCPAATFARVMQAFPARYRVGLTATPKRADGLTGMLHAVIGPIVYQLDSALLPLECHRVETAFELAKLPERKTYRKPGMTFRLDGQAEKKAEVDYTELLNALCADSQRTRVVCDTVAAHHAGMSLVVTERVGHAEQITNQLRDQGIPAVMLAGPGASPAVRLDVRDGIAEGRYTVLVSTPGMVGEGFDLPKLDTLFLAAPHGATAKTQQLAGRVLRPHALKTCGRVFDFVDISIPLLVGQYARRASVYRRLAKGRAV